MKKQMMSLTQFPLFLRFSVRMVFCTMFFMVIFISSQTSFSYSDSTLFISEDSYLYVESPVNISAVTSLSGKNQTPSKQFSTNKRKVFFKLKSPISKNNLNKSNQASFTIPKNSHYIVNTNNPLVTAVLGNSSPVKQHHKMTGSDFWTLPQVIASEKKLLYHVINHINLLKITTDHFSRPPPIMAIFY